MEAERAAWTRAATSDRLASVRAELLIAFEPLQGVIQLPGHICERQGSISL